MMKGTIIKKSNYESCWSVGFGPTPSQRLSIKSRDFSVDIMFVFSLQQQPYPSSLYYKLRAIKEPSAYSTVSKINNHWRKYLWATMTQKIMSNVSKKNQGQIHYRCYPDVQIYRRLGTGKGGTHPHYRVITSWQRDRRPRWCWQNERTLIPYILDIDIDRRSSRRQGYPRKSCNFESIHYWNYEEWVQKNLWHEERHHWGQVWRSIWTYGFWNLDIACRNKEDEKSQNTKERLYSM